MADLVASGTMAAVPMSPYGPSAYPSLPLQTRSLEIPRCSPRAVRIIKRKLKKIQYRPHLIDGCLAATGLRIEP